MKNIDKKLLKEIELFFLEDEARLNILLATPFIKDFWRTKIFYRDQEKSLEKYPLLKKLSTS